MDEKIIWLFILIIIGGLVGGGTNVLAIKMLFRPYEAVFIGKYRVPFTPGLIPKRKGQIADQLGKLVEVHLVTPEGIEEKIFHESFREELDNRIRAKILTFLNDERTMNEWIRVHLNRTWTTENGRKLIEASVQKKISSILAEKQHVPLEELLLDEWKRKASSYIPQLTDKLLERGTSYLESYEGKRQIETMVSHFFEGKGNVRGFFGRMIQRVSPEVFISNELIKLLQEAKTHEMLRELLEREWETLLQKTPNDFLKDMDTEEKLGGFVKRLVDELPIISEWDKPIKIWASPYEEMILKQTIPLIMKELTDFVRRNLRSAMKHVGIQDVVQRQINSFPVKRLEVILLSIASRELKMIALLGALIGGLVGFVQGILLLYVV
ncbi:MAG: DUF445 family protein [Bacillus sp. (in: Bacteria)]|nr:DUF445 family protein [Bacillus sp. (in: firmicutes)]